MRFVYLVMAHEQPEQLRALLDRLVPRGSRDRAVVHLDAASALWRESGGAFLASVPNVQLVRDPVQVRWGHCSQLDATRRMLRQALREPFDMAHQISGADWPVVDRETVIRDLRDTPMACCIEAVRGVQAERMERRRLDSRWLRPDPDRPLAWQAAKTLHMLSGLLPQRRGRPWGEWHKGASWWSLPHDACEHVLDQLDRGFAAGTFAGTVCSDEHAVQTIVAQRFADRLTDNRRFIRWIEGNASPQVLTRTMVPQILASGAWFARKVDRRVDDFFLDPAAFIPDAIAAE